MLDSLCRESSRCPFVLSQKAFARTEIFPAVLLRCSKSMLRHHPYTHSLVSFTLCGYGFGKYILVTRDVGVIMQFHYIRRLGIRHPHSRPKMSFCIKHQYGFRTAGKAAYKHADDGGAVAIEVVIAALQVSGLRHGNVILAQ